MTAWALLGALEFPCYSGLAFWGTWKIDGNGQFLLYCPIKEERETNKGAVYGLSSCLSYKSICSVYAGHINSKCKQTGKKEKHGHHDCPTILNLRLIGS